MVDWETRLTTRDTNRVVRPFEWGVEWTRAWPFVNGNYPQSEAVQESYLHDLNQHIVQNSADFFSYRTPQDFRLERRPVELFATRSNPQNEAKHRKQQADFLRFTSAVHTPFPENNLANARWFPAPANKKTKRAVVVLPHWNSDAISHNALCTAFNWFGISALRLSMPYHDIRRPAELTRADYAVSSNVGRTIDAARQAVADIRRCFDWLAEQGYSDFGILGTSLGACYAFLASAHDPRIRVNVFNHASTYFADVVWIGQSTRHIREGIERAIDIESLRQAWACISPTSYWELFSSKKQRSKFIYSRYDTTFPVHLSREVIKGARKKNWDHDVTVLPCGHYTMGEFPFKYITGYEICSFLKR